ncbi:hypothetical protein C7Y70_00765 [Pseudoalteromonas sp. KS88]|uniref:hypothetical protein n=1 Tax=Pseudoalteromonas sp. KS88 TaxID=2109918 RepID=UPI001080D4D8|nr:hypothetical protein [Pseudoalteromonas sp. KS88]TGE85783.1 hypothetical protein C7Y70_00765 [Pseudoalteromonas sp. KS88]
MSEQPWIKIYNEVNSDCILGNKEGLLTLRNAIDFTLDNRIYSVDENFQADFNSIILVDKNWQEPKPEKFSYWQTGILFTLLTIWAILLPIYALWTLI